jgi:hypothetical protein
VARSPELKECRDCGAAILNERAHRRFHANIVTVDPQPTDPAPSRIRFIGEGQPPNPDPDRTVNP